MINKKLVVKNKANEIINKKSNNKIKIIKFNYNSLNKRT